MGISVFIALSTVARSSFGNNAAMECAVLFSSSMFTDDRSALPLERNVGSGLLIFGSMLACTPSSPCRLKICHWLKRMTRATIASVQTSAGEISVSFSFFGFACFSSMVCSSCILFI